METTPSNRGPAQPSRLLGRAPRSAAAKGQKRRREAQDQERAEDAELFAERKPKAARQEEDSEGEESGEDTSTVQHEPAPISEYEQKRLDNIARNNAILAALGL